MTCRSEPGWGSLFRIFLPAAEPTDRPQEEEGSRKDTAGASGRGETILLVDDEPAILDSVRIGLDQSGYQVLTASSGEQALSLYSRRGAEIDLVILDVSMPGIGGIRCLQGLLEMDPEARVMIASGYIDEELKEKLLGSGAVDYLLKPYNLKVLLEKIRQLV